MGTEFAAIGLGTLLLALGAILAIAGSGAGPVLIILSVVGLAATVFWVSVDGRGEPAQGREVSLGRSSQPARAVKVRPRTQSSLSKEFMEAGLAFPDVTPDEFKKFLAGAKGGNVTMQNIVGMVYWNDGKLDDAEHWLSAAAKGGDESAAYNLGVILRNERNNVAEAERWWKHAADRGDGSAMFALGVLCYERDDTDGMKSWWLKAARAGNEDAMNNIAKLLDD